MNAQTGIRVSEKAKQMSRNSEQGLFHILAVNRTIYSRLLWSFSDCKGKENAVGVKLESSENMDLDLLPRTGRWKCVCLWKFSGIIESQKACGWEGPLETI